MMTSLEQRSDFFGRLQMMRQRKSEWNLFRRIATIASAAAALALLVLLLSIWQGWFWFRQPAFPGMAGQPGAAAGSTGGMVIESEKADEIESRMLKLLGEKGLLVSWYRLAGRTGTPPAVRTGEIRSLDQLHYGQYLLEQGKKRAFEDWWRAFRAICLTESGFVGVLPDQAAETLEVEAASAYQADDFWRANLLAARLLAQSCSLWPDKERLDTLEWLSDLLLDRLDKEVAADALIVVPTAAPILDPGATPTPRPAVTPAENQGEQVSMQVFRLASIDLFAIRQLAVLDARWQELYERWLALIDGGQLGGALPFHAWAAEMNTRTGAVQYITFAGSSPVLETEEAVQVLLHLAEVGEIREESIRWLMNQLYNQGAIYKYYHIAEGTPVGAEECLPAYAMIARIARILADQTLYDLAADRMLWHQATSSRSAALSALFRQSDSELAAVYAQDNAMALLALR